MNRFEQFIGFIAPGYSLKRMQAKADAYLIDKRLQRMTDRDDLYRHWEGATTGRRGAGFKGANGQSANKEVVKYNKALRERSRYMNKNTPTTKRAVRVIANNVVGLGIIPTPKSENQALVKKLKDHWKLWGESRICDWNEKGNFYFLEKLSMKTVALSGECIAIRKRVPSSVNKLGLQIMLLEPDFIDSMKNEDKTTSGGYIQSGIEYNSEGKRIGYWIFPVHPDIRAEESVFIKIEDIAHSHEVDRPGQDRGVPFGSATILTEKDLDDYKDSEIMAKKTGAAFAGFVTNQDEDDDSNSEDYDDLRNMKIEPGSLYKLGPKEDIRFSTPPGSSTFEPFITLYKREIAAGYGVSYEQLTGDYSRVNFSSGRMGWIESSRNFDDWQWNCIISMFCETVYGWFLDAVAQVENIKDIRTSVSVTWTTPRREMIDPVKEVTALKEQLKSGMISWQEVVRMQSYIPDELFAELQEDYKRFKGLPVDWIPPQPPQPPNDQGTNNTDQPKK